MRLKKLSLIEIMVVLAIITILISLLFPALGRARAEARAAMCVSNLKQAGTAIFLYAEDNEKYILTNIHVNTLASNFVFPNIYKPDNFTTHFVNQGKSGYVEEYLGDSDDAYNCPASEYSDTYGAAYNPYTNRQGVYQALPTWYWGRRKLTKNYIYGPETPNTAGDEAQGFGAYNRHPLLFDSIQNGGPWTANWDNSDAEFHRKTNYKIPVIMDDHSVSFGKTAGFEANKLVGWNGPTIYT